MAAVPRESTHRGHWKILESNALLPQALPIFSSITASKNGLLPVALPEEDVAEVMNKLKRQPGLKMTVDLEAQQVWDEDLEYVFSFEVDGFRKNLLLKGLDDIGLTLLHEDKIDAYERRMGLVPLIPPDKNFG